MTKAAEPAGSTSESSSCPITAVFVPLNCAEFVGLFENFMKCQKPDPLVLQQLQALHLEWTNHSNDHEDKEEQGKIQECDREITSSTSTVGEKKKDRSTSTSRVMQMQTIQGILKIMGEYVTLHLNTCCKWNMEQHNSNRRRLQMIFTIHASAMFTPKSKWTRRHKKSRLENTSTSPSSPTAPKNLDRRKEKKIDDKIRSGTVERMKNDDYVKKLFDEGALLCEASIQFDLSRVGKDNGEENKEGNVPLPTDILNAREKQQQQQQRIDNLEERVYTSQEILEGVRRATFSQMDETLSVVELLLEFPYLPRDKKKNEIVHTSSNIQGDSIIGDMNIDTGRNSNAAKKNDNWVGSMLSERVVLRILEDVMFDLCEKEGEDELLCDLRIGDGDGDEEGDKTSRENKGSHKDGSTSTGKSGPTLDKRKKHTRQKKQKT